MSSNAKIIHLRELLAARGLAPRERVRQRWLAGWPAFDLAAGPAFERGAIAELHCPRRGGSSAVARLLDAAGREGRCLALIDGRDTFDPASVGAAARRSLLWVRCHGAAEAVKAADLLLRDGNLPLVLMTLRDCADARQVPAQAWYRLQRMVEQSGSVLLVFTPRAMIPSARVRLTLDLAFDLADLDQPPAELAEGLTFVAERVAGRRLEEEESLLAAAG